jgi:hypothetical protein
LRAADQIREGSATRFAIRGCTHWTEVPWTAEELARIGVDARVVPLASPLAPNQLAPLPARFTVMTYLPEQRWEFYGGPNVLRLAREMPDVQFVVLASSPDSEWCRRESAPANMAMLGFRDDVSRLYDETTVLVRMTQHDGLSFMVLEALAHGRHVVWSYPLGPLVATRSYGELHAEIMRLRTLHQEGRLEINREGAAWVRQEYAPAVVAAGIREEISDVISKSWWGTYGRR